ncbi:MAG: tripartite tricarboxylate transporter substrate binding protein [Comamonadaceae bacterium]|nr:MAG: tripartite tricarboxylate transporter substrate binding protein [Comamonadaceae bacterium]
METSKRKALLVMTALLATAGSGWTQPAPFPSKPIRIIVPFTAGSGSDNSSRYFGEQFNALLGQPGIVENKPGANGIIALQAVKNAPADGYTVLLASNSPMAVNPFTIKDLGYDSTKDFKPIAGLTRGMNVFVVSNDSKYQTIDDLLAAGKKSSLNMGTYSAGYQLAGAWLSGMSGSKFTNVPYKGQAPIMTDIIGNQLDFALVDLGGAMTLLQSGKLKALAVSGEARHPALPNVPTIREKGFPEYVQYSWVSFYVRTQTPDDVTAKLADALQKALAAPAAQEFVAKTGGELMPYPPAKMQQFHLAEIERFRKIAQAAGIKPE